MELRKLVRLCGQLGRRHASSSRVHEQRGPFATLSDVDVATFERLLGPSAVLTESADKEAFNVDWLRTCHGKHFDCVAVLHSWSPCHKAQVLVAQIRSAAAEFLESPPASYCLDYERVILALESRYGDAHLQHL
ncbi:hypothetical protein HPB50_010633 [Hyalomma asiaticum]|uniref:Uncharacterized protein n=1 Tax=Hyalomma asiaticum TaxID=266040 RepID=A0ACB7SDV0_HYAAI|nr:hypothetical protein HPB50_010633 [Hyalomma asiaticum]